MNSELMKCAQAILKSLPDAHLGDYPGMLCMFDGDIFVGLIPIEDWRIVFQEAMAGHTFNAAAVFSFTPPPTDLEQQARECTVWTLDGKPHERPVELVGIEEAHTRTALPA